MGTNSGESPGRAGRSGGGDRTSRTGRTGRTARQCGPGDRTASRTEESGAETRRLFIAIDPPADALAHLAEAVAELEVSRRNVPGQSTRLAPPDRWHLTLSFLGNVPVRDTERVHQAISAGVAAVDPPGPLRIAGGGTFGRGVFTVFWAGLAGDVAGLSGLARAIRAELGRAKVPYDGKPFRPHLTLARPGGRLAPELIAADVAALAGYAGPFWTIRFVHLVASALGPSPRHTRLASVPLLA